MHVAYNSESMPLTHITPGVDYMVQDEVLSCHVCPPQINEFHILRDCLACGHIHML